MTRVHLLLILSLVTSALFGAGKTNIGQLQVRAAPGAQAASSLFEVNTTTKGAIPAPKMTEAQRDAISSPTAGLQVFNTTSNALNLYSGSAWVALTPAAALSAAVASKTGNYTLTTSDDVILADASGGAFTLTLPTAVGNTGKIFYLERSDSTAANAVSIATTSSQIIGSGGATSSSLRTRGEVLAVISDNSNWKILNRFIPKTVVSFTPTGTWSSATTYYGTYVRYGGEIDVWNRIDLGGAPTSTTLSVNIPNSASWTIETNGIPGGNAAHITSGDCWIFDNSGGSGFSRIPCQVIGNTSTSVTIAAYAGGTDKYMTQVDQANPITFGSSDAIIFRYRVPIAGFATF